MSSPIGGFMPIPLAMMMPFMAAQSMLMGDAFGKGFQFGKRKISAMSNEEFNKHDMSAMVTDMQTEFKQLVPTLQKSIIDSRQVQNVIIEEMIKIVPEFLKFLTLEGIAGVAKSADEIAHTIGTHIGHDETPTTTEEPTITESTTVITYSFKRHHISTGVVSTVTKTTFARTEQSHKDRIHGFWNTAKIKSGYTATNLFNEAIAYKTAYEVKYQKFLVPILN